MNVTRFRIGLLGLCFSFDRVTGESTCEARNAVGSADAVQVREAVDGNAVTSQTVNGTDRLSVSIEGVTLTGRAQVTVGAAPEFRGNDVRGRLFTLLDRAHIEYETKEKVHQIACSSHSLAVRISHLQALHLNRGVETGVTEILLAMNSRTPTT